MSEKSPRPYGTLLLFAFWLLLLAAVFYWMLPDNKVPPELEGVMRPVPRPLQSFELTDQDNRPFGLARLQGKWSFVFFGYTYCPDVCPTTLSTLTGVIRQLEADTPGASNIQVVLVSVDPERDTPPVLKRYLAYFGDDFLGLTGEPWAIDDVVRQFGAAYMKDAQTAPGDYQFSHTSSIFLVNPRGQLVATFSPPHDPATIAALFRRIRSLF